MGAQSSMKSATMGCGRRAVKPREDAGAARRVQKLSIEIWVFSELSGCFCSPKRGFEALLIGLNGSFWSLANRFRFSMPTLRLRRSLRDAYRFAGFVPAMIIHGVCGDRQVRIVSLKRRQKSSLRNLWPMAWRPLGREASVGAQTCASTWSWKCGTLKREDLTWLANLHQRRD